jgi:hypothetical protein
MGSLFDQPRNAGTLCKLFHRTLSKFRVLTSHSPGWAEDQWLRYSRPEWYDQRYLRGTRKLTLQTVLATQAIANVVKSSFGPSGLDKMMVDDIGVSSTCLEKYPEC